jgi:hypothetical protein
MLLNFAMIECLKMKLLLICVITLGLMMPQARLQREMNGDIHLGSFPTQSFVSTKHTFFATHVRGGQTSMREVPGGLDPQHH